LKKQLTIVRLYLNGLSYQEINAKAGVSKGTVANVVADLRAGRILDAQDPVEQLELLRELAIDMRRLKITPAHALAGIAIFSHLQELGIEPAEIQRWAAMCRHLAAEETEAQTFVRAALYMEELHERTGLTADALEAKAHSLEEEVARLEPLAQELKGCEQQLEELEKRRRTLTDEISQLEERHEPLRKGVTQKEKRAAELSSRVDDLEQRAQAADERLAVARRELQVLAGLGLSVEDLTGFTQRLAMVAQRHTIEPGSLRDRLLHELEELDAGLGLESSVQMQREELKRIGQSIVKAREERKALDSALAQLRGQQAVMHADIAEEESHVCSEIQAIARIAGGTVASLKQELRNSTAQVLLEVQRLRDQALDLGRELGRYDAVIEANQWLLIMGALVKGDGNIPAGDVRVVGLLVLRGVKGWIQQNQSQISLPYRLTTRVSAAIEELVQWKV